MRHFVHHTTNMGLARSFRDGVDYALLHGADIVVNTDGDNQYPQAQIAELVQPILRRDSRDRHRRPADPHDRALLRLQEAHAALRLLGGVSRAAGLDLPDAASGFRAYSKYSLIRLNIVTRFSYCMETIVQAGYKRLAIAIDPDHDEPEDPRVPAVQATSGSTCSSPGSAIARVLPDVPPDGAVRLGRRDPRGARRVAARPLPGAPGHAHAAGTTCSRSSSAWSCSSPPCWRSSSASSPT